MCFALRHPPLTPSQHTRWAKGGHAHDPANSVTYAGLTLSKPPAWEYAVGKVIGGTMWCVSSKGALCRERERNGMLFFHASAASLFRSGARPR